MKTARALSALALILAGGLRSQTPVPVRLTDPIRYPSIVGWPFGLPGEMGSAVGDFSGDGIPDSCLFVSPSSGTIPTIATAALQCSLGDGAGGFRDPIPSFFPSPVWASGAVASADFDQDGLLDVAVGRAAGSPTVTILRSDGLGGFVPWATAGAWTAPQAMSAGDLDGDGDPDLLLTGGGIVSWPVIEAALNAGPGPFAFGPCFQQPVFISYSAYTLQSALVDMNQDSVLDCVAGFGLFSILPGLGGGCFANGSGSALWSTTGPPPFGGAINGKVFAFADFNHDGLQDLVLGAPQYAGSTDIAVWLHDPTPTPSWSLAATFSEPACVLGLTVGDLDLDGEVDFVATEGGSDNCGPPTSTGNRLVVFRSLGTGSSFQAIPFTDGYAWWPRHPVVTDVNADGWPDVFHDYRGVPGVDNPGFAVSLNAGAFQSPTLIGLPVTGSTLHVYLDGASGGPWLLLLAASLGGPFLFPGIQGSLLLDPSSLVLFGYGTFPPDGNLNVPIPIPNDSSLVGQQGVLQHLGVGSSGGVPAFGTPLVVAIQ